MTPVNLPSDTPISFEEVVFEEDNIFEEPVFLTEEKIGFVADKAVFLNLDEANKTLHPVAEYLIKHPSVSIVLAITTAGDKDSDFTMTLSRQRAETVKKSAR